jgi:hypothetical protein
MTQPPRAPADRFEVRQGTTSDFASVARLSRLVYGLDRSVESIRWLYERNPAGACAFWLANDRVTGEVIALRPLFPWRVRVEGHDMLVAQAGDAMTHPAYRGRGVFTRLVHRAWTELRDQQTPFSFSFPNPGALSVCRKVVVGDGTRVGTHVPIQFRRMVYPLSLQLLPASTTVPATVVRAVDRVYRRWRRPAWAPGHLSFFDIARFDAEFDDLWRRAGNRFGVLTVRDSGYLNWRFIDAPSGRYRAVGVRAHGTLAGYIVWEADGHASGSIVDLFGDLDADVLHGLLSAALREMADANFLKASIWTPEDSPLFSYINAFGFVPRGDAFPLAVHVYHGGPRTDAALEGRRWLTWFGDRDVEAAPPAPVVPPASDAPRP